MLLGLALVIASGCVFNNYLDRGIDKKMNRTKKRALVTRTISDRNAILFASALLFLGVAALLVVNILTAIAAVLGHFFYVIVYGFWKRKSVYGTLVGSISGAVPPVVGYCAVVNRIDLGAILLFLVLVFWQMPHFYAIAVYRRDEYKNAAIPILSVVEGIKTTKTQILFYIVGFGISSSLLFLMGYKGWVYGLVMISLSAYWLFVGVKGFTVENSDKWGRQMFGLSLVVLLVWSIFVSI
jgi:protoheme IX farnesyltransferase